MLAAVLSVFNGFHLFVSDQVFNLKLVLFAATSSAAFLVGPVSRLRSERFAAAKALSSVPHAKRNIQTSPEINLDSRAIIEADEETDPIHALKKFLKVVRQLHTDPEKETSLLKQLEPIYERIPAEGEAKNDDWKPIDFLYIRSIQNK